MSNYSPPAPALKKITTALKPYGADLSKAKTIDDRKSDGGQLKDGIRTLGFAPQAVPNAIVSAIYNHLENDTPPTAPRKAR